MTAVRNAQTKISKKLLDEVTVMPHCLWNLSKAAATGI
jgi:hypothetical protein